MAITPLNTIDDRLPSPIRPGTFSDDMDRLINTKLPRLANEIDDVATAFTLNATNSTSASSVSIGTGTKNYTVQTGKSYVKGMFVIAADNAAPSTNYNYGQVLSYDPATGALSIDVTNAPGSGTKTSWIISQTAPGGVTTAGATFTGDIVVPDEAYNATAWDSNLEVPTKNAIRDRLETAASTSVRGLVELATAAEIKVADAARAISADQLLSAIGFCAFVQIPEQTITAAGSLSIAHNLGRKPIMFQTFLICKTAEHGYSIGDELMTPEFNDNGAQELGVSLVPDSTNINIRYSSTNVFVIPNKTTGARVAITLANWRYVVRAWG